MTVRHKEVNWHRHMTRADLAIDYNTNLKGKLLANKVTRTKEIEVWYRAAIIDGLTVMMSNAHGRELLART